MASTVFATVSTPGPPGPPGYSPKFIVAAGAPSGATGNNGDMYINSSNGDVYGPKTSGAWGAVACNIKGSTGATGYAPLYIVAAGAPSAGTGNNGDMYINSSTSDVYGPKAGGVWGGIVANIKGAPGATGPSGAAGPQGPPGVAYTPRGAWAAGTTYQQGDEASDGGILYIALQSGNTGHVPASSPTWWQPVTSGGGGSQTPWLSDIEGAGFMLKNTGNVGIGNPLTTLPWGADPSANQLLLGGAAGKSGYVTACGNATSPGAFLGGFNFANYNLSASDKRVGIIAGIVGSTPDTGHMAFYVYSTGSLMERIRITPAGLGVGTSSPSALLDVKSSDNTPLYFQGASGKLQLWPYFNFGGNDYGVYQVALNPAESNYVPMTWTASRYYLATGNVGIGSAKTPTANLHIATTSGNCTVKIESAAGAAPYLIFKRPAYEWWLGQAVAANDNFDLWDSTGGVSAFAVQNGTRFVGISNATPETKLHVVGASQAPSLGSKTGIVTIHGATGTGLEIGALPSGPYYTPWIQAQHMTGASVYGLALNPLGGGVCIGTADPSMATLTINDTQASDTAGVGLKMVFAFGATPLFGWRVDAGNNNLILDANWSSWNGVIAVQRSSGYVGIGKIPGYKLDVNGDCNLSAGSVYRVGGVPIGTGGGSITTQTVRTSSDRIYGTIYRNTGSTPMFVNSSVSTGAAGTMTAYTDSSPTPTTIVANQQQQAAVACLIGISFWVLPGNYYKIVAVGATFNSWTEWT